MFFVNNVSRFIPVVLIQLLTNVQSVACILLSPFLLDSEHKLFEKPSSWNIHRGKMTRHFRNLKYISINNVYRFIHMVLLSVIDQCTFSCMNFTKPILANLHLVFYTTLSKSNLIMIFLFLHNVQSFLSPQKIYRCTRRCKIVIHPTSNLNHQKIPNNEGWVCILSK